MMSCINSDILFADYTNSLMEKLKDLCYRNQYEELDRFLCDYKQFCLVNIYFDERCNALLHCVQYRQTECVRILLKHGADCEVFDKKGNTTPLHKASTNCDLEIIKLLIEAGADVNKKANKLYLYDAIVFTVSKKSKKRTECMRYLIEHGARINNGYTENKTILMLTSGFNYINETRLVLHYGSDVHKKDNDGNTAIMFACFFGNIKIIDILLKYGANIYEYNNGMKNAIIISRDKWTKKKLMDTTVKDIMSIKWPLPDDIINIIINMAY